MTHIIRKILLCRALWRPERLGLRDWKGWVCGTGKAGSAGLSYGRPAKNKLTHRLSGYIREPERISLALIRSRKCLDTVTEMPRYSHGKPAKNHLIF